MKTALIHCGVRIEENENGTRYAEFALNISVEDGLEYDDLEAIGRAVTDGMADVRYYYTTMADA